jgi:flagellar hook-associated protein 3 FlgL
VTERITQSMLTTNLLADLQNVTNQLSTTQQQLSSGKSILKPSDDPFGTAKAMQLSADLASNQQYQTNVNNAISWQNSSDTALNDINSLAQQARTLVVQGANGTLDASDRQTIVDQLDQIIDSIKTAANTQYAGSYIFAGGKTTTPPYTTGGTFDGADYDDSYSGDSTALNSEIGPSVQVKINTIGQSVIGDSTTGLLATLRQVQSDLESNPDGLQADLSALDSEGDTITSAQATVGATSNRLSTALSRLQQLQETETSLLSNTQDADIAQLSVDFSQQQAVFQAALKAGASIIQPSLMDFLSS